MPEQTIEKIISELLDGDSKRNALDFARYLRLSEMLFKREKGYWEDKYYWGVTYNDEYVCYILISNEDKTDPESWIVWSDDSGSNTIGDSSADERIKEILWNHVVVCEKVNRCFDGCKRSRKVIYGREIDNVCGTAMKFINPTAETVSCIKKMAENRKYVIRSKT